MKPHRGLFKEKLKHDPNPSSKDFLMGSIGNKIIQITPLPGSWTPLQDRQSLSKSDVAPPFSSTSWVCCLEVPSFQLMFCGFFSGSHLSHASKRKYSAPYGYRSKRKSLWKRGGFAHVSSYQKDLWSFVDRLFDQPRLAHHGDFPGIVLEPNVGLS